MHRNGISPKNVIDCSYCLKALPKISWTDVVQQSLSDLAKCLKHPKLILNPDPDQTISPEI